MAVKLHRCKTMWVKLDGHPCWRVQKALDEEGVEYEVVGHPWAPWKRDELERLSGQKKYPVIEFEDGSVYREESKEMAETIKSGRLMEKRGSAVPSQGDHAGHDHDHADEHSGPPA
jgi:glutaredoxin